MRDSNPRGLAPNPLSNSALVCFRLSAEVHLSLRVDLTNVGGRARTAATETKTETTLMIKLPTVMRRIPEGLGVGTASGPESASVPLHHRR